jgi:hypothetical protein
MSATVQFPSAIRRSTMPFRRTFLFTLFFGAWALLIQSATVWERWNTPGKIASSGGRYFFHRVELPVPVFRQNDPKWGRDPLGKTNNTIGGQGCALTSAAMVLASYGIDTDPQRLNRFVSDNGGYDRRGWLSWESPAAMTSGQVRHAYEDLPTYYLIDSNLSRGNPVIIRMRRPKGSTHFVVIAGKQGYDYLICDPATGASKVFYPLKEITPTIEALRFYTRLSL